MFEISPSAGYTQTLRCELRQVPGTLGRLTSALGEAGGDLEALEVVGVTDRIFEQHRRGKLSVRSSIRVRTRLDLSMAYTPGVGRVSRAIHDHPEQVWD